MAIKLGSTTINKIYVGSTEIKKVYLGSTLIYDKSGVVVTGSNATLTDLTNASDFTFNDVSGLNAHTHVFLLITGRGNSGGQMVDGVTVEGNSATFIVGLTQGFQRAEIWAIEDSTLAPDIAVSWTGTMTNIAVTAIAATGVQSLIALDTATSNADPATLNCDAVAGGIALACGLNGAAGMAWTGVTELYEHQLETSFCHTGGYDLTPTAETPRLVSGNWNTLNNAAAVCASLR